MKFQSTPPARGATLWLLRKVSRLFDISIHAPREGGDEFPGKILYLH